MTGQSNPKAPDDAPRPKGPQAAGVVRDAPQPQGTPAADRFEERP